MPSDDGSSRSEQPKADPLAELALSGEKQILRSHDKPHGKPGHAGQVAQDDSEGLWMTAA